MPEITLFPYQQEFKRNIYKFLKSGGKHALCQGFMRMGKTITFGSIAKDFNENKRPVLILTDRGELLDQTGNSFKNLGLNPFYITAGCKRYSEDHLCYISMTQTLRNRVNSPYWIEFIQRFEKEQGIIIIDECHENIFNWLFESGLVDNTWLLGFTGSPSRRGKMVQFGVQYEKLIASPQPSELLKLDRLVQPDVYGFEAPSMDGVGVNSMNGDYNTTQLFNKFDKRSLYTGVVKNYSEICNNTTFVAYCVSKVHAIKTCIEFNEAGYNVKFIVSDTGKPKDLNCDATEGQKVRYEQNLENYDFYKKWFDVLSGERKKTYQDYIDGKFLGLMNVNCYTKGFDYPELQTVILNYKTISLTRYLQSAARGATASPSKLSYNLLDFGGNIGHFGMPLEDRLYSLWHESSDSKGLPPVKNCGYTSEGEPILVNGKKGCNRMILGSMTICPFCGFQYPAKVLTEGELSTLFLDNQQKKVVKTKRLKDMTNAELHYYWKSKGHKSGWLWRQLWYRGKEESIKNFGKEFEWSFGTIKKAISICEKY